MKERINAKVSNIVEYILNKPVETITHEDYSILMDEMRKIQAQGNDKSFNLWIPMLMSIMAMNSPAK